MSHQPSRLWDQQAEAQLDGAFGGESAIAHHFVDAEQQRSAGELGMWIFLLTELMFFGAFGLGYLVYRFWYPAAFALGSHRMDVVLGTLNTAVLLTSSYTMALAVRAAENRQRRQLQVTLTMTLALGTLFLGIKSLEYYHKFVEGLIPFGGRTFEPSGAEREGMMAFFNLYFLLTGLHAVHMLIGLLLLLVLLWMARSNSSHEPHSELVHNCGLYWHFIDLVWVYLFPLFYLIAIRNPSL